MTLTEVAEPAQVETKSNGARILVVEDDADFRASLGLLIARQGFSVLEAGSLEAARAILSEHAPDVVFADLRLPDGSGLELVAGEGPSRPDVVVISGFATVEAAVDALRQGALDFLTKPLDRERVRAILANAVRTRELRRKVTDLNAQLRELGRFGSMVGRSPAMLRIYDLVSRVAPTRACVLVAGESGTGKELVAETVHRMSPRSDRPFLALNCGAIAATVIESELFGHERGSFTGAERSRKGFFEQASGGTLLLDEITEMPLELQVKLLRVLESRQLFRVGASEPIEVDVRVIAATNRDPKQAVQEGRLREDLYYRLNVFSLVLPPLRERGDDVRMLAEYFLADINAREGSALRWSKRALDQMAAYDWPGNVRELRNAVERLAVLSGDVIEDAGLPENRCAGAAGDAAALEFAPGTQLAEVERKMILATLRMVGGDKYAAAARLGISLKTLYNRLSVYRAANQMEVGEPDAH